MRACDPSGRQGPVAVAFMRLSARSVYQRFFHPVTALTAGELRRLTEVDISDHVAIVLTVGQEATKA